MLWLKKIECFSILLSVKFLFWKKIKNKMRKTRKRENQKDYYCHSLIQSGKKKKQLFKFLKHHNLSWKTIVQNIVIFIRCLTYAKHNALQIPLHLFLKPWDRYSLILSVRRSGPRVPNPVTGQLHRPRSSIPPLSTFCSLN